ncbi:MAG: trypsin-like peptidase domain-containing protein, partial [Acidobacteriota bacterium]
SMSIFSLRQVILIIIFTSIASVIGTSCLQRSSSPAPTPPPPVTISEPSVTQQEQNNVEIYRAASPAVVHITSTVAVEGFFGVFPQQGTGSGSIIDNQGHILTNYHVVRDARRLDVTLADKSTYRAQLVGADPDNDVAVIKIDIPSDRAVVIPLGSSAQLEVGQKALAIGNPFGLDRTLTTGVISGLGRPLRLDDGRVIENVIQTDASINPGNSGGPLLNKYGQLIGINTAIYSPTGGSVGIGFAVPIDGVKKILPELLASGRVRKGYLGITMAPLTPSLAQQFGIQAKQGVIVVEVQAGGPADEAGLQGMRNENQLGDIIISVNGETIEEPGKLAGIIGEHKSGEKVKFGILRQGKQLELEVTLGDKPDNTPSRRPGFFDWLR